MHTNRIRLGLSGNSHSTSAHRLQAVQSTNTTRHAAAAAADATTYPPPLKSCGRQSQHTHVHSSWKCAHRWQRNKHNAPTKTPHHTHTTLLCACATSQASKTAHWPSMHTHTHTTAHTSCPALHRCSADTQLVTCCCPCLSARGLATHPTNQAATTSTTAATAAAATAGNKSQARQLAQQ